MPSTRNRSLLVFLFYFLLFSYPLLSLLWRRSYPLFTLEVGALFLLLAGLSILLALIHRSVRPAIANVLSPLLITITFMLQFNLLLLGVILSLSISLILAWRLRTKFQLYGLPVLITLIMGAYFDSFADDGWINTPATASDVNAELPPVVHILLDSFIGFEGLPPYPVAAELKTGMYSFFDAYDFQVFPRAYSRYSTTGDSLYAAMNFKNDSQNRFALEVLGRREHVLTDNAEFAGMEALGYRLNVYQTGYLDFCQSNPDRLDRCWQYPHPNVPSIEQASSLPLKIRMLAKVLLSQSTVLSNLVVSRGWLLDQGVAMHDPQVFANLKDDLTDIAGGRFYFAHVLLPHGPFAYTNDCSVNYESPLWARYAVLENEPVQSDEIYKIREAKYFEQITCALNSLGQIFDAMKTVGIYERSVIVVHGDHGSMIGKYGAEVQNLGLLTPAGYRASFSTLFAVKIPGQGGRVDNRVLSLGILLEAFLSAVQGIVTDPDTPTVFLQTLPDNPEKTDPYVYLMGTHPPQRVDINIFAD